MRSLDNDGSKTFLNGTHRVTDPGTTLARVMPLAARMGITRVAMLTGLDVLGIPVAAAMRPNSRSIAVHQGKGLTRNSAKASALMEAVECYHAEVISLEMLRASFAELPDAVDPAQLPRSRGRAYRGERLPWVAGSDLLSGRSLWLPHELVSADFAASMYMPTGLFQATTNGLAAGNHWLEAVLHALYEVVERDAVALWRTRTDAPQNARALDPSAVDGKLGQQLLVSFAQAGVAVRIWDVTSDIGLPAFVCLAVSPAGADAVEPELGSGCHADRDIALARALTEAAQARLTRISGARDDFEVAGYQPEERAARQEVARRWIRAPTQGGFRAPARLAGPTLRHDLNLVLRRLSAAGITQVGCVDLRRPALDIPVVRVVVPGLEGPWTPSGGGYTPGRRAQAMR
jgi:YcaO-like protein with predicted kinase domain